MTPACSWISVSLKFSSNWSLNYIHLAWILQRKASKHCELKPGQPVFTSDVSTSETEAQQLLFHSENGLDTDISTRSSSNQTSTRVEFFHFSCACAFACVCAAARENEITLVQSFARSWRFERKKKENTGIEPLDVLCSVCTQKTCWSIL